MMNQKIIYGNCWVAYLDFLGFRNNLNKHKGHIDVFANNYEEILQYIEKEVEDWRASMDVIWCSDSFLFYTYDDSIQPFTIINMVVQHFFYKCIGIRWPLRGALSIGEFYIDKEKNIFFGQGYIDAYDYGENQDWIGLVLSPKAFEKLKNSKLSACLDNGGLNFLRYDVPFKKKKESSNIVNTNKLYAFKMTCFDCKNSELTEKRIKEMMCLVKNDKEIKKSGILKKIKNTLKFIQDYTKSESL